MPVTTVRGQQITDASVSLTVDVTGTLPAGNGGTGNATNALNNVLLGNGTGALQAVAPGASGNVLSSNGTTWSSTTPVGGGDVTLGGVQTLTNKTLTSPRVTAYDGIFNGTSKVVELGSYGTPANYILIETAPTGNGPVIASAGSDANSDLFLSAKGTGNVFADGVRVADISTSQTLTNKTITDATNTVTFRRVMHGAVAGTARPLATHVEWVGSVIPTNATTTLDTWIDTA